MFSSFLNELFQTLDTSKSKGIPLRCKKSVTSVTFADFQ